MNRSCRNSQEKKSMQDEVLSGQQSRAGAQGIKDADAQGHPDGLFYPVQPPGTVVLAHKGGGRHADAGHGQDVEAVDLHVSAEPCHGGGTVAVHTGLHQHVGNGDDHVLDAGGQAHPDDAACHAAVQPDAGKLHMAGVVGLHQKAQAQHAGDQLAQVGGDGGTGHPHFQPGDEHQVQHDVGHRRSGQIHQ